VKDNEGMMDMVDRFTKLELKVDKLGDIFQQIATSQGLMQQELKLMNMTLLKVDNINLSLASCSTTCKLRQDFLDKTIESVHKECLDKSFECDKRFVARDKIMITLVTSTALLIVATILQHIAK
jgi:hypothetical protein